MNYFVRVPFLFVIIDDIFKFIKFLFKIIINVTYFIAYPGIFIKQIVNIFFIKLFKLRTCDVLYFDVAQTYGFKDYEDTKNIYQALVLILGPFLISTILCSIISFPFILISKLEIEYSMIIRIFSIWISLAIGIYALPDQNDLDQIRQHIDIQPMKVITYLIGSLVLFIFNIADILKNVFFDIIYAIFAMHILFICYGISGLF